MTSDSVWRTTAMGVMALGVGLAVIFSTLRPVVANLELWYLPAAGYILILGLTFLSSELSGRLAFDGGRVAPGPMVTTFVLVFAQGGTTGSPGANLVVDGLGLIPVVTLMPPIAIQLLGILLSARVRMRTNLYRPREAPHENDASGKPDSQGSSNDQDNQNKPNPSTPERK